MAQAHADPRTIDVFSYYYRQLQDGATGIISEAEIAPILDLPRSSSVLSNPRLGRDALDHTVVIKLNGGMGTSMGMDQAKSLLPVHGELSFLDLIVAQVMNTRHKYGVRLPLVLMSSLRTRAESRQALSRYPELVVDDLPLDFVQSLEPKLKVDDLTPVRWPADPLQEWCPPGHGDIYTSLVTSGMLERLLSAGYQYATVSNSDNLGAVPDPHLAGWFAASGAPYAAEVSRRTAMDRKGGHLAIRKDDGRLILRDTAQTDPTQMHYFTDTHRHPYFHTNNLWWDLRALAKLIDERGTVLGLPLIRNLKTVDPDDASSTPVIQIETAMGAAIEVFSDSQAIVVDRARFLPVKTTNELLLLQSDCYQLDAAGVPRAVGSTPVISLGEEYRTVSGFQERFPAGPPSLRQASSLHITGDWTFGADVTVIGDVHLDGNGGHVPAGTRLEGQRRTGIQREDGTPTS